MVEQVHLEFKIVLSSLPHWGNIGWVWDAGWWKDMDSISHAWVCCTVLMMLTHNVEGLKKHNLQPLLKLDCFTLNLSFFTVQLQYQCWVRTHSFFLVFFYTSFAVLWCCCTSALWRASCNPRSSYCCTVWLCELLQEANTVLITKQKTVVKLLTSLQQICLLPLYRFPVKYLSCPPSLILSTVITSQFQEAKSMEKDTSHLVRQEMQAQGWSV